DFSRAVDALVAFADDPCLGGYRPGKVQVRDQALAEYLGKRLFEVGIDVECTDHLPVLDRVVAALNGELTDDRLPPGALSGHGVTLEKMRAFADAAKAFYQADLWNHLTDEDLIRIELPKPPPGMQIATVLGASGRTFGLGFFSKPEEVWDIRRFDDPAEWFASRRRDVWCLTFDGITRLPVGDADLWEDHHLPVAGDSAYPCALCHRLSGEVTRPNASVLAFLEGLLRALAESTEPQIDSGRWSLAVETAAGLAEFTLSLPDLLKPPSHKELMDRGFTPDRRALEQMHAQMDRFLADKHFENVDEINAAISREFVGKPLDPEQFPPRNALEKAQDLCYQAFDSIGRRQLQLAREALKVCPDCADAYVLLAERTGDVGKAAELYAQGVTAGERALGPDRFENDAGHFWGLTDTRPYMRARLGLASCLERLGRNEEALDHYRELLRLNPGDNQGIRYLYLPLLLKMGLDAEAARFMKDSRDEPTANWTYTRALLAYRLGGDCAAARTELRKAVKANPYVTGYLLAEEDPDGIPASYSLGSREQAILCASELRSAFAATPGALQWLENQAGLMPRGAQSHRSEQGRRERDLRRKRRSQERKRKRG
ncbi:MAG: tetratricopeptide repeat protein, partial [Phycisphaerae bacterium]